MSFIEPTGEHVLLGETPPLAVREAELVRDIAMKEIRHRASTRTVSRTTDAIAHRFVLYDNSGGEIGSGLTDTLLSVSVAKKDWRFQSMRISFLELLLKHDHRYSNYREIYAFDWFEDNVFAHKTTVEILGNFATRYSSELSKKIDIVTQDRYVSVMPVQADDCDELCSRMLTVAYNAADLKKVAA